MKFLRFFPGCDFSTIFSAGIWYRSANAQFYWLQGAIQMWDFTGWYSVCRKVWLGYVNMRLGAFEKAQSNFRFTFIFCGSVMDLKLHTSGLLSVRESLSLSIIWATLRFLILTGALLCVENFVWLSIWFNSLAYFILNREGKSNLTHFFSFMSPLLKIWKWSDILKYCQPIKV